MILQIIHGDILLIARIFPRPCGARKNTTQLVQYPRVLSVKPSNKYILLTTLARDRTGRISALGLLCTDLAALGPYCQDLGPIFSRYGPEQAWLIRDLLHDWKQSFKIFCFVKKKVRAKRKARNDPILTESL